MAKRGDIIELFDYTGGLNVSDPEYLIPLNQSPDAQNIELLDYGFRKRNGDSVFNSSAMVSSATPVVGGGYIKFNSGTEFLNAIAGTKFFTSSGLTGTMADATGAITITSGQDNIWTPVIYNNLQIWFGGAPNAPFKYSGSGNAAALGGSPPSAATAFQSNNYIFAISTAANPSRIYWPVITNPEDWTGTGSGNADVSMSDGEALQCGVPVSTDTTILFKNSSTHLMVTTRQPFPIYQLQKGVGIAGRYAFVNVRGAVYFITPGRRMLATSNGASFEDFPDRVNAIFDRINPTRIPYIQGYYHQPKEQIHWYVSLDESNTNDTCIIWDLQRKCWLWYPTGYAINVPIKVKNRLLYGGQYDGKIYFKDNPDSYTDASETTPAIDAYWRLPFRGQQGLSSVIHPHWIDAGFLTESATTISMSYGFDFAADQTTESFSLQASGAQWDVAQWDVDSWGGQNATIKRMFVFGRGNVFSPKIRNAENNNGFTFQGMTIQLRSDRARKLINVT